MTKDKLIINEHNYEGYKQLHNVKTKMSNDEYRNNVRILKKSFITLLIGVITVAITPLFGVSGLMLKGIMLSELVTLLIVEGGLSIDYLIKVYNLKKEKVENVKENYPYIDTDIDLCELENVLKTYESNKSDKENDISFEKCKEIEKDKVIEDGSICFEDINKNEYYNCVSQQHNNSHTMSEMQEDKKVKVKTLIK